MNGYGLLAPVIERLESWTVDDALEASKELRPHGGNYMAPLLQWQAWHEDLPRLHLRHQQGDQRALLQAVDICGFRGLPMPPWCRRDYSQAWSKARSYEVRTLDEAFGYEVKGTNLARARERYRKADLVAIDVARDVDRGSTVEQAFHAQAEKHGVSPSRAREWYYERRRHGASAVYLPEKPKNPRKD